MPAHHQICQNDIDRLQMFVDNSANLTVLTGAGISTESGIPDYRSAGVGLYARNGYRPMNYAEFVHQHSARQRYWARSFLNWNRLYNVKPNSAHLSLSRWERAGKLTTCITQNVDRLHHKAGTESVIELHGNLYTVKCLQCNYRTTRILFQRLLTELNQHLLQESDMLRLLTNNDDNYYLLARPDGDIDVNDQFVRNFKFPYCNMCDGILKPDIVFFGDNVQSNLVNYIYNLIDESDSLLILGSSLQVFSSYRFLSHSHNQKKKILIVNIGPTRAEHLFDITRLNAKLGDILPQIKV